MYLPKVNGSLDLTKAGGVVNVTAADGTTILKKEWPFEFEYFEGSDTDTRCAAVGAEATVIDDGAYECEQDTCFIENAQVVDYDSCWEGVNLLLTQAQKDAGWSGEWREGFNNGVGRCLVRNWNMMGGEPGTFMDPQTYETVYRNETHVAADKAFCQSLTRPADSVTSTYVLGRRYREGHKDTDAKVFVQK